jgi:predicted lipid carrier protein YhbT
MATVSEVITLASKLIDADKARASAIGAAYRFVLSGDGGGTFLINLTDDPGVVEGDSPAQCTFEMDTRDFVDLFEGRAGSRQLFFAGKLRLEGDIGLAMKLKKFLDAARQQKVPA